MVTKDIRYLDEVLTMSARMFAYTADNEWKNRYDKHIDLLDEKLAFISTDDEVKKLISLTDNGNKKLIKFEKKAFLFISQDNSQKAQLILNSKEYFHHKKEYTNGLNETIAFINKKTDDVLHTHQTHFMMILVISVSFVILMVLFAFYMIRLLKKEEEEKLEQLNQFNANLTKEVEKQTKQINEVLEKFTFATDNALAGFWEIDLDTDNVTFSDGWFEYLGYTQDEFADVTTPEVMKRIIHCDDMARIQEAVEGYLSGKIDRYNVEFRVLHKSGQYKWINAMGALYQNKFFGFHVDIDNLKHANDVITVQSKIVAMGEMIGNIAHQWRQPLNLISTKATGAIFQKEIGSLDDEQLVKSLESINDTAQYLSKTIDTFRNFIKSSSEKQTITTTMQEEINAAISLIDASFHTYFINIEIELEEEPIEIVLAEGELTQVVINILNNAKDILVENNEDENRFVQLNMTKEENNIIITITDNAGGVPEDILPRIFEPYFTTKHQSQGTGLGLNMSYKIVTESMGGKLYVQNIEDGAKFFIEIPL
jgi:PAS domain S-box-containing protein